MEQATRHAANGDDERGEVTGRRRRAEFTGNSGSLPASKSFPRALSENAKETARAVLSTGESPLVAGRGLTRD